MPQLTAETITDEQIRELLESLRTDGAYECSRCGHEQSDAVWCHVCGWGDLYWTRCDEMRACYAAIATNAMSFKWTRDTARARCADLINARAAAPTCDFHDSHDPVNDRPTGNRCGAPATHRIEWADGRHSFGCAAHLVIEDAATVKPISIAPINARAAGKDQ